MTRTLFVGSRALKRTGSACTTTSTSYFSRIKFFHCIALTTSWSERRHSQPVGLAHRMSGPSRHQLCTERYSLEGAACAKRACSIDAPAIVYEVAAFTIGTACTDCVQMYVYRVCPQVC